jgi:alcohol dehydrogenase
VDTVTKPVLRIVQPGRLDAKKLVSHRFEVSEIMTAYDTFGNDAKSCALKAGAQERERKRKSLRENL